MEEALLPQIEPHGFETGRDAIELRFVAVRCCELHQVERRLTSRPMRLRSCRHNEIAITCSLSHSEPAKRRGNVGKQSVTLRRIAHMLESFVTEPHCVRVLAFMERNG